MGKEFLLRPGSRQDGADCFPFWLQPSQLVAGGGSSLPELDQAQGGGLVPLLLLAYLDVTGGREEGALSSLGCASPRKQEKIQGQERQR